MTSPLGRVVGELRGAALRRDGASDGQLLERFLRQREEAAFAALVRRYGPMVLGVCRRLTGHSEDAEDAFQATFLVLARKAASVHPRERVGCWLYGVARRTALKARTAAGRRRTREQPLEDVPYPPGPSAVEEQDLRALLDQELGHLPERHRLPILLCDVEGRTLREVAGQLSLPVGTLSNRLTAARQTLARRLTRRGVALTGCALAAALASSASASVPPSLVEVTVRAAFAAAPGLVPVKAAALAEGVLRAMMLTKLKLIGTTVLAGTVLATAGLLLTGLGEAPQASAAAPLPARADQQKDQAKKPAGPTVQGTVQSVDTSKKPVTVTVTVMADKTTKKTEEKTLPLAADAKFFRDESSSKDQPPPAGELGDLTEGTSVTLQLDTDGKMVVSVHARGPAIGGHVKEVDPSRKTLTMTTKEAGGLKEYKVELAKDAKVIIDDGIGKKGDAPKEGQLSDVTEGSNVVVQLSVTRKNALNVRLQGASLTGTLKGYDAGNRLLTVTVKEDAQVVDKTLTLAEGAKVDGDLTAGNQVSVRLAVKDSKVAVAVSVRKDN